MRQYVLYWSACQYGGQNTSRCQLREDGHGFIIFVIDGESTGFSEAAWWFDGLLRARVAPVEATMTRILQTKV